MPRVPSGLPALGRGRHRSPKKGACLMEYASLLAGERWSDSPSCTHPALATLARAVNDCTGDQARQGLLTVVPDIVHALGVQGEQKLLAQRLARLAALHALPVATGVRRRTVLVALLGAELACGGKVGEPDPDHDAVRALLRDPDDDLRSAARFVARSPKQLAYDRKGITNSLHLAITTIADAGEGSDELLRDLLVDAVSLVRGTSTRVPLAAPVAAPVRERVPAWR